MFFKFGAAIADFEFFNVSVLLYVALALTTWSDGLLANLAIAAGLAFACAYRKPYPS
jgi:hypothetical protein